MESAESLKQKGNDAIGRRDFQLAASLYSKALSLEPENAACLSNRSYAYLMLKQIAKSVEDAQLCCKLKPEWAKGFLRLGSALMASQRFSEAIIALERAKSLDSHLKEAIDLLEQSKSQLYDTYISPLLKGRPVSVRWMGPDRGRGVIASRNFNEGEVIFTERPISSQRTMEESVRSRIDACHHCMKSALRPDNLPSCFTSIASRVSSQMKWITCPSCSEDQTYGAKYCSERCRVAAWESYHKTLCTGLYLKQGLRPFLDHPLRPVFDVCRAHGRTNPPLILKMMATVIQSIISGKHSDDAWLPFKVFAATPSREDPKCFLENEAILALLSIIPEDEEARKVATVDNYRFLHGVITRNAQTLFPVSDFHLFLNSLEPEKQQEIVDLADKNMDPMDFSSSDTMTSLCIRGTGLYAVANTMNHSCLPNAMIACASNNDEVTIVCTRFVSGGEELLISYIDESGPLEERKKQLQQFYDFECRCLKCRTL